ncbi:MAG: KUP/HAK/KT family potassium transporter [Myxococcales bacterium]|nr:KUP/HAK/KT family potassium transporter [Myxococcales bacterium]
MAETADLRSAPKARPSSHTAHDGHGDANLWKLALGALGVVYGDIGTSPLYAVKECVHGPHSVPPNEPNVMGLLSLMFWAVTLVVSFKYVIFVLRANNQGEGGVLAMLALLPEGKPRKVVGTVGLLTSIVLIGSCLLYGEGIITPAISVLSAVEGLGVATHAFEKLIVPITVVILIALFAVQKRGTGTIGRVFGPIMIAWFLALAGLGVWAILKYPKVLLSLSPTYAVDFFRHNGTHGFTVLGSVVLCITGSEALYADMGHFGPKPIRLAWFSLTMPALALNYLGQGALLLANPADAETIAKNPFYSLVPQGPAIYPLVALATAATVIASQALISGAYSLTRQAVQLGFLPRVRILHTSSEAEGQIFIPEVNGALAVGCIALVLAFQSSSKLAAAYGIAVMGTMAITSTAFFMVCLRRWDWPLYKALPLYLLFVSVELVFLSSNLVKFFDGGFVPLVIAAALFMTMRVWKRGRGLLAQHFARASKPLDDFLEGVGRGVYNHGDGKELQLLRPQGVAVFLTSNPTGTPPLLMHHARHNRAIHSTVLLVTVLNEKVPRVTERHVEVEPLLHGFFRVRIRVGFMETPDVPAALAEAAKLFDEPFDLEDVTYYLGRETLLASAHGDMGRQAERLFAFLSRNSNQAPSYFGIPPQRVVEIGMQVDL